MKKSIISVLSFVVGVFAGAFFVNYIKKADTASEAEQKNRFKEYYNMLNQWMIIKQEGESIERYFEKNGYKAIAIYGMGEVGNRLYDDLKESNVNVEYAIDINPESTYSEIKVYNVHDNYPEVDAIVISPIFDYNEIKNSLCHKVNCPIISLNDIIFDI